MRVLPWSNVATALAALALFVRMMVPAGYMPTADPGGLPALVICSGQLAQSLTIAPMRGMMHGAHAMTHPASDKSGSSDHASDHACPFGALAASVDRALGTFALPLPVRPIALLLIAPLFLRPGIGLAAPPPPKTGPPTLD